MAKSQQTFKKKEKEKKKRKKKKEKLERKLQRKKEKEERGPQSFEDMLSYVDHNGNLTDTPPDPSKKPKVKAEDIIVGIPPDDETEQETERKGKVKFFNEEKGFGFIIDSKTGENIFVHINNLSEPLQEDDRVSFEVEMGPKGPNAVKVYLLTEEE